MKHSMKTIRANIPWLLLLFCIDAFAALLLWIADVQAFYAMTAVIVLATVLLFTLVCFMIVHR
ncbi:MAG: sensor histidine kinase, partial [Lachnospiraceae bacterium]|nr:sensor histidine kinase [Lachnospiraceae bacterium]